MSDTHQTIEKRMCCLYRSLLLLVSQTRSLPPWKTWYKSYLALHHRSFPYKAYPKQLNQFVSSGDLYWSIGLPSWYTRYKYLKYSSSTFVFAVTLILHTLIHSGILYVMSEWSCTSSHWKQWWLLMIDLWQMYIGSLRYPLQ